MPIPHPTDPSCVFCKIVAGQIPSHKVYEDDLCFAFLDIGPIVAGHTLVVPKAHYANLLTTPPEILSALATRLAALAKALLAATGRQACHVLTNVGPEASQSVQHLHYHILPRFAGDGYKLYWPAGKLDAAEAARLKAAIAQALAAAPT